MKTIAISDFKARCIGVLRQAQDTGEALLVTRRGSPIVRIEPLPNANAKRQLGVYKGRMRIFGDLVYTDTESDWEMLK